MTADERGPSSTRRGHRARDGKKPMRGSELGLAWLLGCVVVGSLLAVGTVHVASLLGVSVLAVAAAALAVRIDLERSGKVPLSAPLVVLLALVAYTLFQAAPLPMGLLQKIAPANADVWARALLPFGEPGPRWASISLDPGATLVEALKWFVYACVFAAATVIASRRGAAWGVGIVFLSAIVAALTTIGHGLAGATKVFGVYQPTFAQAPWHVGPLLNPNNLAGYLNLGAMCGLGLLLMRRPIARPWAVGLGVATIVGVAVTSASRAGFVALPIGVLLFALVQAIRRAREKDTVGVRAIGLLVGAAVAGGAFLAFLGGTRETWAELYDKNLEKLAMLLWTKPMIGDHRWLGIGRGAFETVFPAYRPQAGNLVFTYAEDFPAQWMSEWGLPVALIGFGLLAWYLRPRVLGVTKSAVAAGGAVGVAIVLFQNLFDLALEIPAVCIAIAMALGSIWGDSGRREKSGAHLGDRIAAPARLAKVLPASIAGGATVLVAMVVAWGMHPVAQVRQDVHETLSGDVAHQPDVRSAIRRDLRAAMLAHPAEPYFPLVGAVVAWLGRDENPIPWLQRSLERAQINGRAHLLLAQVLGANGAKNQALLELKLAARDDVALTYTAARLATHWTQSYDDVLRVVPEGKAGAGMLELCAALLGNTANRAVHLALLREALARDPSGTGPHSRLAADLLGELGPAPRSDDCKDDKRAACVAAVEDHARQIERQSPAASYADRIRAQLLELEGKLDDAARLLAARCPKVTDRMECLRAQVDVTARIRPRVPLDDLVKDVLGAGCATAPECAGTSTWLGDVLASRGEWGGAMTLYERVVRDNPSEAGWQRVASAASQTGAHARAADALERAARLKGGGGDAETRRRINEERAKAVGAGGK